MGPDCPRQKGPIPKEGGLRPSCYLIQKEVEGHKKLAVEKEEVKLEESAEVD